MSVKTRFVVSSSISDIKDVLENAIELFDKIKIELDKIDGFEIVVNVEITSGNE